MSIAIGKKIKALRKTRGMNQEELANQVGNITRSTISNYEIGRRTPSLTELNKIAQILGVSLDYFGVGSDEIHDLIARARVIFDDDKVPIEEKSKVYKEVMRLYLNMEDKNEEKD